MDWEILLMTWTISPSKTINYRSSTLSPVDRELQYFKSILYYITQSNFWKIVFCENSNHKFNEEKLWIIKFLSKLYNKEIELLCFKWDYRKTNELWYWYGEWECIDYAIDNSKLLKESKMFYKVTWRYIIWNINQMIDFYKKNNNIFIRYSILQYFAMDTAFFKIDKSLYKEFFYNAKTMVNHQKNSFYETVFHSILLKNNLYKCSSKINLLPIRINCNDNYFSWNILRYSVTSRGKSRYDTIFLKLWLYSISWIDKFLYPIITPLTRRNKN